MPPSLLLRIDQPDIANFDAGASEFLRDLTEISFEARLQSIELRPIGLESDPEQAEAGWVLFHRIFVCA